MCMYQHSQEPLHFEVASLYTIHKYLHYTVCYLPAKSTRWILLMVSLGMSPTNFAWKQQTTYWPQKVTHAQQQQIKKE